MKAKTHTGNGYIYFAYEDYDGLRYDSYKEMERYGRKPLSVFGYHYSYYFGNEEPIDELELDGKTRPTFTQIKDFISRCKQIMEIER